MEHSAPVRVVDDRTLAVQSRAGQTDCRLHQGHLPQQVLGGGASRHLIYNCWQLTRYQVTSFRNGLVILCIILIKDSLGGDLITKEKGFLTSPVSVESFLSSEIFAMTSMLQILELKASFVPDISSRGPTEAKVSP